MDVKKLGSEILHTYSDHTQGKFWGGASLPYFVLVIVTVLFGFFGFDHLVLGSPSTAILKCIGSFLTFGLWYFYDVIQILTDKENVMKYGLSMPIAGPLGIGAGKFTDGMQEGEKGGKFPWRWILFSIAALLPFGFDYVIAGDYNGALLRFFLSIFWGTWFLSFLWWAYNLARVYFTPTDVLTTPMPRIFPWSMFMEPNGPNRLGPTDIDPKTPCEVGKNGLFGSITQMVGNLLGPAVGTILGPYGMAVKSAGEAASATAQAAAMGASTMKNVVVKVGDAAKQIVNVATDTAVPIAKTLGSAAAMVPQGVDALSSVEDGVLKVAEQAAKASLQEAAKQTGGGASESGFLGWFLVGIVAVGLGSALLRQKRFSEGFEEKKHASDTPPKPGHA